jgi:hypothetical protein
MIWFTIIVAILITMFASVFESRAYIFSFEAFRTGNIVSLLALSFAWYSVGIIIDYFALFILTKSPIFIPEILSTIFMVSTIVGIAVLSGQFLTWARIDQAVGVLIVIGIAWLSYRVGK